MSPPPTHLRHVAVVNSHWRVGLLFSRCPSRIFNQLHFDEKHNGFCFATKGHRSIMSSLFIYYVFIYLFSFIISFFNHESVAVGYVSDLQHSDLDISSYYQCFHYSAWMHHIYLSRLSYSTCTYSGFIIIITLLMHRHNRLFHNPADKKACCHLKVFHKV